MQNKFPFTSSRNMPTVIMNIPSSISQPRKTILLPHKVQYRPRALHHYPHVSCVEIHHIAHKFHEKNTHVKTYTQRYTRKYTKIRLQITDQWYIVPIKFRFGRNLYFLAWEVLWCQLKASFHTSADNCERNTQKWNSNNKKETIETLMWLRRSYGGELRKAECFATTR